MAFGVYLNDDFMHQFPVSAEAKKLTSEQLKTALIIGVIVMGIIMILVFGLIYFLLYGRLIRKLKRNYRELKKLEV